MADVITGSWIGGADEFAAVAPDLIPLVSPAPGAVAAAPLVAAVDVFGDAAPMVKFPGVDSAIKRLAKKGIATGAQFRALRDNAEREATFTVARLAADSIEKIRDRLATVVGEGIPRQQFVKELAELPISEAHVEHVYRNAVNSAYKDGLETTLDNPMVVDEFPYRLYSAIHDERTRDDHIRLEKTGLNGTAIYHKDDPAWLQFSPPWSWQCRCAAGGVPLTIERAASMGVKEAKEWVKTGIEPAHVPVPWPTMPGGGIIEIDPLWVRSATQFAIGGQFVESEHPRGQPDNSGKFAKGSGGATTKPDQTNNETSRPVRELTKAGKEWHKPSKLKMMLYHGTATDFDSFDIAHAGKTTDEGELGRGIYFSTDTAIARNHVFRKEVLVRATNPLALDYPAWGADKKLLVRKAIGLPESATAEVVSDRLASLGFDSVALNYAPVGYNHQEVMVIDNSQVVVMNTSDGGPAS